MPTNSVGASETFAGRSGTSCDLTSNRRIEREAPAWGFEPQSPGPKPGSLVQTSLRGQPGRNPLPNEPNRATDVRLAHRNSATGFLLRAIRSPAGAGRAGTRCQSQNRKPCGEILRVPGKSQART